MARRAGDLTPCLKVLFSTDCKLVYLVCDHVLLCPQSFTRGPTHYGSGGLVRALHVKLGPWAKDEWGWALSLRNLQVRGQGGQERTIGQELKCWYITSHLGGRGRTWSTWHSEEGLSWG